MRHCPGGHIIFDEAPNCPICGRDVLSEGEHHRQGFKVNQGGLKAPVQLQEKRESRAFYNIVVVTGVITFIALIFVFLSITR